jgi:hypothetical protein
VARGVRSAGPGQAAEPSDFDADFEPPDFDPVLVVLEPSDFVAVLVVPALDDSDEPDADESEDELFEPLPEPLPELLRESLRESLR